MCFKQNLALTEAERSVDEDLKNSGNFKNCGSLIQTDKFVTSVI